MTDVHDIDLAVDHIANNQEFIRLYNRHNRELLLQHFLLIAAAGDEVWRANQQKKMPMPEQRDLMLIKYLEWLDKMSFEFPEVQRPPDVNADWWRLMLLAYERKAVSGKSLWRKFKEDTRNPILSSFNVHWAEPREGESLETRFRAVRRGVWKDLGHRDDEFLPEGTWLPKQWYAWRYCCYPGKNFRSLDGKLPGLGLTRQHRASLSQPSRSADGSAMWPASLPVDSVLNSHDAALHSSMVMAANGAARLLTTISSSSTAPVRVNKATLPTLPANQRLLSAATTMSRAKISSEEELSVQQYLADVQRYTAQMARLEKAVALAESFGEQEKAAGFKRQLYEHVQSEPPSKRPAQSFSRSSGSHVQGNGLEGTDASSFVGNNNGNGTNSGVNDQSSHNNGLLSEALLGQPHPGMHLGLLAHNMNLAAATAAGVEVGAGGGWGGAGSASMPVLEGQEGGEEDSRCGETSDSGSDRGEEGRH